MVEDDAADPIDALPVDDHARVTGLRHPQRRGRNRRLLGHADHVDERHHRVEHARLRESEHAADEILVRSGERLLLGALEQEPDVLAAHVRLALSLEHASDQLHHLQDRPEKLTEDLERQRHHGCNPVRVVLVDGLRNHLAERERDRRHDQRGDPFRSAEVLGHDARAERRRGDDAEVRAEEAGTERTRGSREHRERRARPQPARLRLGLESDAIRRDESNLRSGEEPLERHDDGQEEEGHGERHVTGSSVSTGRCTRTRFTRFLSTATTVKRRPSSWS